MRRVTSWIVAFLFACLFVMFIQMFLVKSAVVQTDDMSPTLNKGDRVIINKIKVTFNMLKDGDIIMYRHNNQLHLVDWSASQVNQLKLETVNCIEMIDKLINFMLK